MGVREEVHEWWTLALGRRDGSFQCSPGSAAEGCSSYHCSDGEGWCWCWCRCWCWQGKAAMYVCLETGGLEWVRGCGVNHPPGALLAGENRYPFAWKCLAAAADLGRIPSSHGPSKQPFLCLALPWPCCPALPQARRALSTHPSPPLPIIPHGRVRIAPFGILPKNHAATAPGQPSGLTEADKRSSPASRPTRTSREPQPQVHSAPLAFTSASTISLHRPPSTRPTPTPAMTSFFGRLKSGTVSALLPCLHAP